MTWVRWRLIWFACEDKNNIIGGELIIGENWWWHVWGLRCDVRSLLLYPVHLEVTGRPLFLSKMDAFTFSANFRSGWHNNINVNRPYVLLLETIMYTFTLFNLTFRFTIYDGSCSPSPQPPPHWTTFGKRWSQQYYSYLFMAIDEKYPI